MEPRTVSERVWKYLMERFAGGRNVMLATGGSDRPPSRRNSSIKWIFSTSLYGDQMTNEVLRNPPSDGTLRLVIACRQEERKGTDVVIDALPLLIAKFENATLDVIGDGSMLTSLKRQADRLNIKDRVLFHGKIRPADVLNVMKTGHLFCYPTSASEGFPKVVLEALATGLPVITTKVSVLPSLLKSGCGILLKEGSADELVESIEKICSDPNMYSQMSKCAIDTAREYSLEHWRDLIGGTLSEAWKVDSLARKRQVPKLV
jgi:glycosyltransferase involved in cell wall biosynthesis